MLFNSQIFIFLFLPLTYLVFFLVSIRYNYRIGLAWLVGASLFFYGWWNPVYLLLISFSIITNYFFGVLLKTRTDSKGQRSKPILVLGIALNLILLGYFKYANFIVDNINALLGSSFQQETTILPLAISFFTFQQIAYLVDVYKYDNAEGFLRYSLFVSFFPQLIAGPIVHHKEMMTQFSEKNRSNFNLENLVSGLTIFFLGLFKKVVLADGVAVYSSTVFDAAASGATLTFFPAWYAALAYTLQLYFDFSGYADMAIGLAKMFGIQLPLNFNSPYKSKNIIEFWRRWHMTLSRFLRDYLYIPLGGNRNGSKRQLINLMITMLLGGLWHGPGWTFVFWGGLHGFYLVINHVWQEFRKSLKHDLFHNTFLGRLLCTSLTFLAVVISWVFFRAETFDSAIIVLEGMIGIHGVVLPTQFVNFIPVIGNFIDSQVRVPYLADGTIMGFSELNLMIFTGLFIVFFGKNLHELTQRQRLIYLIPTFAFTAQEVIFGGAASEFLYFRF